MERRAIEILGRVQGVGFRPFVYGLASRLELSGFVRNRTGGVFMEVEGESASLDIFIEEVTKNGPPLAHVEHVSWVAQAFQDERRFRILASEQPTEGPNFVSPDVGTCADCLLELFDPNNRRYRYPFLNCTNCGPRLTIVNGAPYDRERTTMASFTMCAACQAEYDDPMDRRFHAQPIACADCGPHVEVRIPDGKVISCEDAIGYFAEALRSGKIGAMKGLGGYHLICDARNPLAVAELRRRKQRDEKPFAVMVADLAAAEGVCEILPAEKELLSCARRPIVLMKRRALNVVDQAVAPQNPCLGIMLPYTPLHYLLANELTGVPLVMTSGNRSDEPIAYEDEDAIRRLGGIADLFLTHNRAIRVRCDDSVTRMVAQDELPIRRSRGYAPQPIALPFECPQPILAVGGELKATFALGTNRHGFLSHHLGDLHEYSAYRAFTSDIELYQQLFGIRPECIAHDLHPDYASTRYAIERAGNEIGLHRVAVQHHHAHMASCMVENGLQGRVIGVTLDGSGYGSDGAIWGGEFLTGDYGHFRRAAHLRNVGLPGGDKAIREPWRMALAHLIDAGVDCGLLQDRVPTLTLRTVAKMLDRRLNAPMTSSAGRLFDAVAVIARLRDRVNFEGQVAIELEWKASEVISDGYYPFELMETPLEDGDQPTIVIDTRPLIRAAAYDALRGTAVTRIGRRFHSAIMEIIATVCVRLRRTSRLDRVVLSGGVFMNALLTREVCERLQQEDFKVYRHRLVPPNDGGLSLGQLAVACKQMA